MDLIRFIINFICRLIRLLKKPHSYEPKDESDNSSIGQIARLSTLDGYTITDSNGQIITIKEQ